MIIKSHNMKNIIAVMLISFLAVNTYGQDKETIRERKRSSEKGGFKKDHLFTGGDITLAFSNTNTTLGASPYFGYSINKYVDVAASFNYIYASQRDALEYGDKARLTQYGPGAFVRLYPFKFAFAQIQYEHNFIRLKYFAIQNSNQYTSGIEHFDSNSLLVGAGYAGGELIRLLMNHAQ